MSEEKRGKKRPKSYYIKCSAGKKKRINDLDSGMKGFLITCNTHEKEAVRESYNILNEYADKLYEPEVTPTKAGNSDSDDDNDDDDDDMEKAMAKEASKIKDIKAAERRFQNVDCKAKNCIFIKTTLDDPCGLAHAIFSDLEETKVQKARHAIRMLPITATCKTVMKNIEETAERIFKPVFETEFGEGLKFTSICKIRNNQSVSRMAILPNLSRIIKEMNPLHTLCYDEPDYVILVEIIRNICCLSVIKDFFRFRKYNLHEVLKTIENSTSSQKISETTTVSSEQLDKTKDAAIENGNDEKINMDYESTLVREAENSEEKDVQSISNDNGKTELEYAEKTDNMIIDAANLEKSEKGKESKVSEDKIDDVQETATEIQTEKCINEAELIQSDITTKSDTGANEEISQENLQ